MTRVNPKRKKARAGYMISAVAELYKLHPQTLRLYERVKELLRELEKIAPEDPRKDLFERAKA